MRKIPRPTPKRAPLERKAAEAMDSFISMYGGPYEQYDLTMPSGIPLREIVKAAKKLQVSLTVIGTHGRTGMDHIIIGTTAERVIREADCPVPAVRLSEKA